jgi:ubiquinone/menaquinone biosynthesis C-methylase UbiE
VWYAGAGEAPVKCQGGGTGAFSIPLARRGNQIAHLDLLIAMPDVAQPRARDLFNLCFVEGNTVDLSQFPDAHLTWR